jgi:hypothetical protein
MLWLAEKELIQQMLLNWEGALAWDWTELGRFTKDVCPPYKIKAIKHKAWQCPTFRLPKKLEEVVIEMIRDWLMRGVLELCDS